MTEQHEKSPAIDFVGGLLGGVASTYIGHPLDTVKVRLQTQKKRMGSLMRFLMRGGHGARCKIVGKNVGFTRTRFYLQILETWTGTQYRGAWDCFGTIVRQEKLRGLYKGVTSPLMGIAGMNATIFFVYGRMLTHPDVVINHWWAGCWAGLAQSVIISPVELIKTQMQIQGVGKADMKNYRGWRATCRHIINYSGYHGFYRGLTCCIVRDIPSFGAFFYTYELLIGHPNKLNYRGDYGMQSKEQILDFSKIVIAGGLAGIASWLITYPADVIKDSVL